MSEEKIVKPRKCKACGKVIETTAMGMVGHSLACPKQVDKEKSE